MSTSAEKNSQPNESTPNESTPNENAPNESTPKESTPNESTPNENAPNENTPSENTSGNSEMSDTEKLTQEQPSSEPPEQSNPDPEAAEESKNGKLGLEFTKEDLYDFNLDYIKGPRGILNICHIVFSMLVMSLVGSTCRSDVKGGTGWTCRVPDTFAFVIATSAFLQSLVFFACCLLSKKCDKKLLVTLYELVYYVVYTIAFFFASLAMSFSKSMRNENDQFQANVGACVFGFLATIAYGCSAGWLIFYHKIWQKMKKNGGGNQQ